MYINNNMRSVAGIYGAQSVSSSAAKKPASNSAHTGAVQLSSQAQDFSAILQKIRSRTDSVRMDKVTELESRIAEGNYTIDENAVAASMLNMRY